MQFQKFMRIMSNLSLRLLRRELLRPLHRNQRNLLHLKWTERRVFTLNQKLKVQNRWSKAKDLVERASKTVHQQILAAGNHPKPSQGQRKRLNQPESRASNHQASGKGHHNLALKLLKAMNTATAADGQDRLRTIERVILNMSNGLVEVRIKPVRPRLRE